MLNYSGLRRNCRTFYYNIHIYHVPRTTSHSKWLMRNCRKNGTCSTYYLPTACG